VQQFKPVVDHVDDGPFDSPFDVGARVIDRVR
jgi:hypothetical protein